MSRPFGAVALVLLLGLALRASAGSTVPATFAQSGRLLDSSAKPITGDVPMAFAIYAGPTGGAPLWTETRTATLDDGYFAIQLGAVAPLPAATFDGSTLYLGVAVGADPEMTPREQLVSVPYALVAQDVIGDIHPRSVVVNGVTVIKPDGELGTPNRFGGIYSEFWTGNTACPPPAGTTRLQNIHNPFTGSNSCPPGFTAQAFLWSYDASFGNTSCYFQCTR